MISHAPQVERETPFCMAQKPHPQVNLQSGRSSAEGGNCLPGLPVHIFLYDGHCTSTRFLWPKHSSEELQGSHSHILMNWVNGPTSSKTIHDTGFSLTLWVIGFPWCTNATRTYVYTLTLPEPSHTWCLDDATPML